EMDNVARHQPGGSRGGVLLEMIAARLPLALRAWLAYCDGLNEEALKLYAQAIDRDKTNPSVRVDRARVYFNMNRPDSARLDLLAALQAYRTSEKKDLVFFYQSRALVEHSLAVVYQRLDSAAAAKNAYSRALQED